MLRINKSDYKKVIEKIVISYDTRELLSEFSKDRVFYYSLLKDISKGNKSPNFRLIEKFARNKKIGPDFIVHQAKFILTQLVPDAPKEDYYKILNVPPTASMGEIRRSWLALIKMQHPDIAGESGIDVSKKLNEAYSVLADPAKRREYDARHFPDYPVSIQNFWTISLSKTLPYVVLPLLIAFAVVYLRIAGSRQAGPLINPNEENRVVAKKEEESPPVLSKKLSAPINKEITSSETSKITQEKGPQSKEIGRSFDSTKEKRISPSSNKQEESFVLKSGENTKPINEETSLTKSEAEEETILEGAESDRKLVVKKETAKRESEEGRESPHYVEIQRGIVEGSSPAKLSQERAQFLYKQGNKSQILAKETGQEAALQSEAKKESEGAQYIIQKGDSLWLLARRFNTSVSTLKKANNLRSNHLNIGDVLVIPGQEKKRIAPKVALTEQGKRKATIVYPQGSRVAKAEDTAGKKLSVGAVSEEKRKDKDSAEEKSDDPTKGKIQQEEQTTAVSIKSLPLQSKPLSSKTASAFQPTNKRPIEPFVYKYVSAYKDRDLDRFISLFAPDAKENGANISKKFTSYEENFSTLKIVRYDVKIKNVEFKGDRAIVDGDFAITFRKEGKLTSKSSNGTINWLLSWRNNAWKIKEINYSVTERRMEDGVSKPTL